MFDLTGMTALVTGASGGIGSAITRALAAQGARIALSGTREEALRGAERAAGCKLLEIEGSWARAWSNVLAGQEPWPSKRAPGADEAVRVAKSVAAPSVWQTLGLTPKATTTEIKRAYRQRALAAHPDRGGSDEAFRALQSAYESALKRRAARPNKIKPR